MIDDFRAYDGGGVLECDLCIAGAGAAGITLAMSFAGRSERVILLESGGLEYEAETQSLYQGTNIGRPYFALEASRLRFFGGSTNHWGGMCAPLDERDFEARPWVPYSGWPITHADFAAHLPGAHEVLDLGPVDYDAGVSAAPTSCRGHRMWWHRGCSASAGRPLHWGRSTGPISRTRAILPYCCTPIWSTSG